MQVSKKGTKFVIPLLNIKKLIFVRMTAVVAIEINAGNESYVKLSFFQKMAFGSSVMIIRNPQNTYIRISLFDLIYTLTPSQYYELISALETFAKQNNLGFEKAEDEKVLLNPAVSEKLKDEYFDFDCNKCGFFGKFLMKTEPYIVQCPQCNVKCMEIFCPKCGMGGYIYANEKKGLGIVDNLETHPSSWVCTGCKNVWKIDPDVYESVVMAQK